MGTKTKLLKNHSRKPKSKKGEGKESKKRKGIQDLVQNHKKEEIDLDRGRKRKKEKDQNQESRSWMCFSRIKCIKVK